MVSHRVHDVKVSSWICLLAELVTIDTKTIKHGILIEPRLLSFDWLELSSPLFLQVGSTQIFLELTLFCLQALPPASIVPQTSPLLLPQTLGCLLQPAAASTLQHPHCSIHTSACFMPSWLQPGITAERPASSYGSHAGKRRRKLC